MTKVIMTARSLATSGWICTAISFGCCILISAITVVPAAIPLFRTVFIMCALSGAFFFIVAMRATSWQRHHSSYDEQSEPVGIVPNWLIALFIVALLFTTILSKVSTP